MPGAKFYLQTRVSGGKIPQFSVLSRELHAFPMKVTRYDATSGGDKSICVEICETTKEGKKGLLKCAVYVLGYVYIFTFNQKLDILSIPPSLYLTNRKKQHRWYCWFSRKSNCFGLLVREKAGYEWLQISRQR